MAEKKYLSWDGLKVLVDKIKEIIPAPYAQFNGTSAEWEALTDTEKAAYDSAAVDDVAGAGSMLTGVVEEGNENAVTSDAVYNAIADIDSVLSPIGTILTATGTSTTNGGSIRLSIPAGTWLVIGSCTDSVNEDTSIYSRLQFGGQTVQQTAEGHNAYGFAASTSMVVIAQTTATSIAYLTSFQATTNTVNLSIKAVRVK